MTSVIYDNLSAHAWITYCFLVNGLLVSQALCICSDRYKTVVETFEARVLSFFFISVLFNGAALLALDILAVPFAHMKYLLPVSSVFFLLILLLAQQRHKTAWRSMLPRFGRSRPALYGFVFVILLYNGGLIEQIADSWWHLSLANKIAWLNTFDARDHLLGTPNRYYPPLWHGNLALLHTLSDISLPVLWNAFTAWGGSLKVMGFYLLALALSKDQAIALLSALLFVFLPGLGDSYLRVSAWPSHIAYTAWFCLFYVTFSFFDACGASPVAAGSNSAPGFLNRVMLYLRQNLVWAASFAVLAIIILFTHQAELLWFACGIFFYALWLSCYQLFSGAGRFTEPAGRLLRGFLLFGLLGITAVTCLTYYPVLSGSRQFSDFSLILILVSGIVVFFLYLLAARFLPGMRHKKTAIFLLVFLLAAVLLSVDLRHFLSLFKLELGHPLSRNHEGTLYVTGLLGDQLKLPGWHMQLRNGFLYSGALAIVISVFMAVAEPNRRTMFLAANAVIPFLFLISPYFYQWLTDVLGYLSAWRIGLLVFSPVILAGCTLRLWRIFFRVDSGNECAC